MAVRPRRAGRLLRCGTSQALVLAEVTTAQSGSSPPQVLTINVAEVPCCAMVGKLGLWGHSDPSAQAHIRVS